jgi:hypothetical protein
MGIEHNSLLYFLLIDETNRQDVGTIDVGMAASLNKVQPKLSVRIKMKDGSAIIEVMFCLASPFPSFIPVRVRTRSGNTVSQQGAWIDSVAVNCISTS